MAVGSSGVDYERERPACFSSASRSNRFSGGFACPCFQCMQESQQGCKCFAPPLLKLKAKAARVGIWGGKNWCATAVALSETRRMQPRPLTGVTFSTVSFSGQQKIDLKKSRQGQPKTT